MNHNMYVQMQVRVFTISLHAAVWPRASSLQPLGDVK